jgi:hypothetical protein
MEKVMNLSKDSIVVKMYNAAHWLSHQFWNTERRYDDGMREYYDSDEEYQESIDRNNKYLKNGSNTDICTVGRKIFILGPMYTLFYISCYALIFYFAFGSNVGSFGLLYTLKGIGFIFGILCAIVGAFIGIVWLCCKITNDGEREPVKEAFAAVSNAVKNNSLSVVIKTWYASFKERTCVLLNVKETK